MNQFNPFEKYGIKRVINAATSATTLGGTCPDPRVMQAMTEAARCFVYIPELQASAGRYIAEVTGAEAGLPTAGAVAGLMLGAAACIMKGTELEKFDPIKGGHSWSYITTKLPVRTAGLRTDFIVQKPNRNSYDFSPELAGGHMVEVGASKEELKAAYDPKKTAGYYYTARSRKNSLPLEDVVEVAHSVDTPILVDAASEVPPKRKLRLYTNLGADLVVFSGGKHISGPNNSGFIVGRKDLIKLAHLQSYPFNGIGRSAKMSREAIVGLVEALRIYIEHDEKQAFDGWMRTAEWMRDQLRELPGVDTGITFQRTVEDGEPIAPFTYIRLTSKAGITAKQLNQKLKEEDPVIYTLYEPWFLHDDCAGMLIINPEYLLPEEAELVVEKVKRILRSQVG